VFDFEIFGTNSSSDGIICYEIEGKPVFGFWGPLLAKNSSLNIYMTYIEILQRPSHPFWKKLAMPS
jgi:hypothetical protein